MESIETFEEWLRRQTSATLMLWQRQFLSDEEALRKLCELSWSLGEAERLLEGAYLLLSVM